MSFVDEILEKIAAKKSEAGGMKFDPQAQRERELIIKYKNAMSNFEKKMALNDLKMAYRELTTASIQQSGILGIMDYSDAQQFAENTLAHIFDKFDLNQPIRPASYVMGRLKDELMRERYNTAEPTVRRSSELTMKNGHMKVAEATLKKILGRQPTEDEIYNYITKEMGKQIERKDISRNFAMNRTILSGNQQVGTDESNAEFMTLMDMKHVSKKTPEQLMAAQSNQAMIDNILSNNFNRVERKMLRSYYGMGEFKSKALNANKAATNAGITYYEGKKIIERFEKLLEQQGLL